MEPDAASSGLAAPPSTARPTWASPAPVLRKVSSVLGRSSEQLRDRPSAHVESWSSSWSWTLHVKYTHLANGAEALPVFSDTSPGSWFQADLTMSLFKQVRLDSRLGIRPFWVARVGERVTLRACMAGPKNGTETEIKHTKKSETWQKEGLFVPKAQCSLTKEQTPGRVAWTGAKRYANWAPCWAISMKIKVAQLHLQV